MRQAVEHHNLIVEKNRLVDELQQTNARLLEANRLKGAFIEVASHELKRRSPWCWACSSSGRCRKGKCVAAGTPMG